MGDALRLALTTFTVLPVRAGRVDRPAAAGAIALAPAVGLLLGALAAAVTATVSAAPGGQALLAASVSVAALALATRGLHLDGLADTADGLGCHGDPERTRTVMKSPQVGAFGAATLVLVLLTQVAAVAALASAGRWWAVAAGVAAGRIAIVWACRRGAAPARPDGLGALVADSQPRWRAAAWTLAVALAAGWGDGPGVPLALAVAAVVTHGALAHLRRRVGGVTGDTLGAVSELATTLTWAVAAMAGSP